MVKKVTATLVSLLLLGCSCLAAFTGCANTRYMMTVNDEEVAAGIYIYYALNVFTEAVGLIQNENAEFDPTSKSDVENQVFNGKYLVNYVQDTAEESVKNYYTTMNTFSELGLSLDAETQSDLNDYVKLYWDNFEKNLTDNGISKNSMREVIKTMFYNQEIFNYYYGEDGEKGITEDMLKDYFITHNARIRYIAFNYQDDNGAPLEGNSTDKVVKIAEKYQKEIEKGSDFEEVRDEWVSVSASASSIAYATSLSISESEAISSDLEAATGTNENGETLGTSLTTSTTVTTTPTTTTTAATTVGETTTTTTADPYLNEQIIISDTSVTTTAPDIVIEGGVTVAETSQTYAILKEVDEAIFAQKEYNTPFLVKVDNQAVFLIEKYDITERMTADDLWTDGSESEDINAIDDTRVDMFQTEFLDFMNEKAKEITVVRNEDSFKRYKPWKFIIDSTV